MSAVADRSSVVRPERRDHSWAGRTGRESWELAVAAAAVLAAAVAVWVTLEADFLAHPEWLAVQKADIILGPVFVGLYWLRVRPESRFGPCLLGYGVVCAVYTLQSSAEPWLFGIGVAWEAPIYLGNLFLMLTFPTGRLEGRAAKLIMAAGFALLVPFIGALLLAPQFGPDGSIAGCLAMCPENPLAFASRPELAADLYRWLRIVTIAIALATGALLVWRMLRGTPPQRRAVRIGASVALVFTVLQIAYQFLKLVDPDSAVPGSAVQWGMAASRSLIWYGFLAALIAAQLFAGRALHRLVRRSLRRPSKHELETILREPLGDPELRLVFQDAQGAVSEPGRAITLVEREDRPAVAIVHDPQLKDDPELLQAAGAVALLAAENAELDAAWNDALNELRESRKRIVTAADGERRKVERDLHDGVQQRLVALRIELTLAHERASQAEVRETLAKLGENLEGALEELRGIAHGLYPPLLNELGVVGALEHVTRHTHAPVTIAPDRFDRFDPEIESAIYYCCLEAIQNATKHGGPDIHIGVAFHMHDDRVAFEISDDGPGFDAATSRDGAGIRNMHDRVGALDGRLSLLTAPGQGTIVSATIPLNPKPHREPSAPREGNGVADQQRAAPA